MLKEKLQQDVKDSLKNGDKQRRLVLGMVLASIKNKEIEKRNELDDEEITSVVSSEIKKRKDAIEQYEKGGRSELAEQEKQEIRILMNYLPEQMSEEQIRTEVEKAISEIRSTGSASSLQAGSAPSTSPGQASSLQANSGQAGPKDIGKVLGILMSKIKGKADGQFVSQIVKEELSKQKSPV
ncbi:MAG: glutamyl-tRNA amidotransferase [Candidatus Yanofskybacteria bacterium CG10_big_fil_rev_8_21_14_0_10_37_15]|uniref:Glutamyl-tRNA amidotransferase n=1 Tax=Candidatus Yanofskybacteria bacterium CG10_big_fil_rev_8_21_14_0_10_37_15 TaxID=1975097 RepID=A0A2H0R8C4_9BACT|nr:MAG: glutamyl-tRNA amidotransferase [Candidatus Yanofskybacteria bacterium CG10_big_fil_rev_8_21_14_0_10_37_15]